MVTTRYPALPAYLRILHVKSSARLQRDMPTGILCVYSNAKRDNILRAWLQRDMPTGILCVYSSSSMVTTLYPALPAGGFGVYSSSMDAPHRSGEHNVVPPCTVWWRTMVAGGITPQVRWIHSTGLRLWLRLQHRNSLSAPTGPSV